MVAGQGNKWAMRPADSVGLKTRRDYTQKETKLWARRVFRPTEAGEQPIDGNAIPNRSGRQNGSFVEPRPAKFGKLRPDVSSITVYYDNWIKLRYKLCICLFSSWPEFYTFTSSDPRL